MPTWVSALAILLLTTGCIGPLSDDRASAPSSSSSGGPAAPKHVIATEGNTRNAIKWRPVAGATAYHVLASTVTPVTAATAVLVSVTPLTSVVHAGLANDLISFYYAVFALTPSGQTSLSSVVSATPTSVCAGGQTPADLPTLPSGSLYSLLRRIDGKAAGDAFGSSVSMGAPGEGDVNGDGKDDLVIGAPTASPSGVSGAGSAFVCSGAGTLLFRLDGDAAADAFGRSVALVSDLTGDGKAEVLIGAPGASPGGRTIAGSALVFSGADGSLLFRFDGEAAADNFGAVVASGDVDGDGKSDFVIGAPQAGGTLALGRVYVFSGNNGSLIFKKDGNIVNGNAASCMAVPGDLNGDGKAEVAISSATTTTAAGLSGGSAWLLKGSGISSSTDLAASLLAARLDGRLSGDWFGQSVSGAGDVNGDGTPDLLIGAPAVATGRPGTARVFSGAIIAGGAGQAELFSLTGETDDDQFGFSVSRAGVVGGDPRLVIGAPKAAPGGRAGAGKVLVFSGQTRALLFSFEGQAAGEGVGATFISISGGADTDGDAKPDFAVGAPGSSPAGKTSAGRLYLFGAK